MSGLVDSVRNGTATANGFVDETVRAVRILAATEQMLAKLGPAGVAECRDLDLSGRTNGVLAAVCQVELDRLPTTLEVCVCVRACVCMCARGRVRVCVPKIKTAANTRTAA